MTTIECHDCVLFPRNSKATYKPGYVWSGAMGGGDWEICRHCGGTGYDPDYSGYQVVIDGCIIKVEDLSKEDAVKELIKAIDRLEDIDELAEKLRNQVEAWRDGK